MLTNHVVVETQIVAETQAIKERSSFAESIPALPRSRCD
jgi:hypothetical protein